LLDPQDGHTITGRITFRWTANFTLRPGQAFEPIFWREGEDPMSAGKGYRGTTQDSSIEISFASTAAGPGYYFWGVLLVQENPYKRLNFLGGGWRISVSEEAVSR